MPYELTDLHQTCIFHNSAFTTRKRKESVF